VTGKRSEASRTRDSSVGSEVDGAIRRGGDHGCQVSARAGEGTASEFEPSIADHRSSIDRR
jgi:hypothetical protein